MKLIIFSIVFLLHVFPGFAQNKIEWTPDVQLTIADYQSPSTEVNDEFKMYAIGSNATFEFSYQMSYYEFMLTKNFNNKVNTVFNRNSSYITAPTSKLADQLVDFGKLEFDLAELAARKFRKRLYEAKGVFTNTDFFQPLHDEIVAEQMAMHNTIVKTTDLGSNAEQLALEREKIRKEIDMLADFCKSCKPPKKAKKK